MQLKSKILILGAIITLLALTAIQGYLIYNTYELKKSAFTIDARNAIAVIYGQKQVDSLMWDYRNDFLKQLESYKKGQITKPQVLENLKEKVEPINVLFNDFYNEEIKKNNLKADIKCKIIVTQIQIVDSLGLKTDFVQKDNNIFLLGENFDSTEAILINNSTWQQDHDFINEGNPDAFGLNFKTSIYMNILNWKQNVLKVMAGLLFISVLLFIFVLSLLYYSIYNLLKQKKLAEIKTDFINNITHELKTPLSTLAIATKTLTNRFAQDDKAIAEDTIKTINRQNRRLQNIVDEFLSNSVSSEDIKLNEEEFFPYNFLNNLVEDFKMSSATDIEFIKNIEKNEVSILADKFYLGTALLNILNNAVKYGGKKIEFTYIFDKESRLHIIYIKDNGIGMSSKYKKQIFEKFYRISEKDRHNYKGLGLGLYYSNQIIKVHKGELSVKSKIKEGSTFIIKIPTQQP
ncbi:hypothetical protein AST99_07240 [Formosa algae]|nr:hypothetical protein AST99_07240 [Formosa algae]